MRSTDTLGGWYPQADRIGVPASNYAPGNQGRAAVVIHVMDGSLIGTISWFASPKSGVSSHFGIDEYGNVKQFVSILDTSFANGLTYDATRKCWVDPTNYPLTGNYTPTWQLLQPPINPNRRTITIERAGRPRDTPSAAMTTATVLLLRWLAVQYPQFAPYEAGRTLIGHSHIAPRHRANCPGPNADLAGLARVANGPPAPATYRVTAAMWVSETPGPYGPIALQGAATLPRGAVVEIDEVKEGWAHLANQTGFVPIGGLERI